MEEPLEKVRRLFHFAELRKKNHFGPCRVSVPDFQRPEVLERQHAELLTRMEGPDRCGGGHWMLRRNDCRFVQTSGGGVGGAGIADLKQ